MDHRLSTADDNKLFHGKITKQICWFIIVLILNVFDCVYSLL